MPYRQKSSEGKNRASMYSFVRYSVGYYPARGKKEWYCEYTNDKWQKQKQPPAELLLAGKSYDTRKKKNRQNSEHNYV
jgi:hypothetical protein